jgi:hypothetical protein
MTVQEQQMIDDLVDRIRNTNLTDKDPDAEQRLQEGLASYPDAIYVLAQTVLVQKYGLEQAQQKMQAMQAELDQLHQQPRPHGSFLGNLLGLNDQPPVQPPPPQYAQPYPPQAYPPPVYAAPAYAAPQPGGFLRSATQTAAGVAMGEIAFQGMESLFHGFGGGSGYGYGGRPEEIVNNNYYGESNEHEHHGIDSNASNDSSFYNPGNDASRDNSTDAAGDNDTAQADYADSNSNDDFSSSDDSTSSDDSSSSDGGF